MKPVRVDRAGFVILYKKVVDFVLKSGKIVVYVQGIRRLSCIQGGNYG